MAIDFFVLFLVLVSVLKCFSDLVGQRRESVQIGCFINWRANVVVNYCGIKMGPTKCWQCRVERKILYTY